MFVCVCLTREEHGRRSDLGMLDSDVGSEREDGEGGDKHDGKEGRGELRRD